MTLSTFNFRAAILWGPRQRHRHQFNPLEDSMALFGYQTEQVIKKFQRAPMDTGSSEVQIALLTTRIRELTGHFKAHKKDVHSRMGLVKMVNRRKKLLAYLRNTDPAKYTSIIQELELRK
jgi:small subunit ribosomal protein S15